MQQPMPDSPQALYVKHLLSHRGYPLWTPEPSRRLPHIYLQEGLRIGDVGVVVPENGSFDVFFNICLPVDHPLHRRGVPGNFEPIILDREDIDIFLHAEEPRRVIPSTLLNQVSTSEESCARIEYDISLPPAEGALLVLPQGADHYDLRIRRKFLEEALKHAVDCAIVVAGFFSRCHGASNFPVQFTEGQFRGEATYTWRHKRPLDWRSGLPDELSNGIPNQSVFISGFKIAINDELLVWKKITVRTETGLEQPEAFNVVGTGAWLPKLVRNFAQMGSTSQASKSSSGASYALDSASITDNSVEITHVPQIPKIHHPSDIINRWLFDEEPSAKVAVTHDSQWSSLLESHVHKLFPEDLFDKERLESVLSVNDIIFRNGAAFLQSKGMGASTTIDNIFADVIGCDDIIKRISDYQTTARDAKEKGIMVRLPSSYIFIGPPGSGKRMIARKLGQVLHETEYLPSAEVVEYSALDLMNLSQSSMENVFEECLGKVLFISKAHKLSIGEVKELKKLHLTKRFMNKFIIILSGDGFSFDRDLLNTFEAITFQAMTPEQCMMLLNKTLVERGVMAPAFLTRHIFPEPLAIQSWMNGHSVRKLRKNMTQKARPTSDGGYLLSTREAQDILLETRRDFQAVDDAARTAPSSSISARDVVSRIPEPIRIIGPGEFQEVFSSVYRPKKNPSQALSPYEPYKATQHVHLARPLFALIIGIDNYTNFPKLSGAVNDATAMKQYLVNDLCVPEDHICTLTNDHATRGEIIRAFQRLQYSKRVKKDDAILIYYAGYGGELPAPRTWNSTKKIQCLIPQDNDDSYVFPIPDRTIGALLEDIAKKKGNNITVILDCCHSASGSREKWLAAPIVKSYGLTPRSVKLRSNIPETLDFGIWGARSGKIPAGFAYRGHWSHILLAACGEEENTHESHGHGLFTSALLFVLKDSSINDLTYTEVIDRIYLDRQNPQCEGVNRYRALFDTRVPGGRRVHHEANAENGKCVVHAGSAHGISSGVELALYLDEKDFQGTVVVDGTSLVEDFKTTVMASSIGFTMAKVTSVKLNRIGKLALYLGPGEGQSPLAIGDSIYHEVVEEFERAKLEVRIENNSATFRVIDQVVRKFSLTELPYKFSLDDARHILNAAAHFFWYLDLKNKKSRLGTKRDVSVDFYALKKECDDYGFPDFVPVGPGFCRTESANDLGVIEFDVDPEGRYGIKIENKTTRDLYLNAFLFNYSDLSIYPLYTQSSAGIPQPPLKKAGIFTLGYGSGGVSPFMFKLQESQGVYVSYLKIFFSTRAIDLSDIEQTSPFPAANDSTMGSLTTGPPNGKPLPKYLYKGGKSGMIDIWFAVQIPLVGKQKDDIVH